jgi:Zn-dependent peptidase ImmA (M78 family)
MKNLRAKTGPVKIKPFFKNGEIEDLCLNELKKVNLLPSEPSPIRIDRFIEKRFKITHDYQDMDEGILGYTKFSPKGVEEVHISRSLDEEGTDSANRRIRTTLAHEAGHGLLHAYLFTLGKSNKVLFDETQPDEPKILCRDIIGTSVPKKYNGQWWEYQANKAMVALLLPKILVQKLMNQFLGTTGFFGVEVLSVEKRLEAIKKISVTFDVNPVVAKFYLQEMYPLTDTQESFV